MAVECTISPPGRVKILRLLSQGWYRSAIWPGSESKDLSRVTADDENETESNISTNNVLNECRFMIFFCLQRNRNRIKRIIFFNYRRIGLVINLLWAELAFFCYKNSNG